MKTSPSRYAESRGKHNHDRCVSKAMRTADDLCAERGLNLTPLRKQVLELVWARHAPVGAYELLEQLSRNAGKHIAPPTVYRAIEFLLDAGLIHRIDTLNAFLACDTPAEAHSGQFLVCRQCHQVTELFDPAISRLLASKAKSAGFVADAQSVEIKGLCASCQAHA
jgi:Fur family zinc uptake transcriptional regulator